MYFGKKRNIKAIIAVVIAAIFLALTLVMFSKAIEHRREKAIDMSGQGLSTEAVTETFCHLTIMESSEGEVIYNPAAKLSGNSKETVYSVLASDSIDLRIIPVEGKLFDYAEIMTDGGEPVTSDLTEEGIRFIMPSVNTVVTIYYMDDEEWLLAHMETETETEEKTKDIYSVVSEITEAETETEIETDKNARIGTEAETERKYNTYNMKLYNATEGNTKDFGNPFIADKFLQSIGEDFGVGDPSSYYYDIGKVTFAEEYPEQEEGVVKRYLFFEDDPEWMILATFYPASGIYFFEDTTDRASLAQNDLGAFEGEASTSGLDSSYSSTGNYSSGSYGSGNSYGGGSYSVPQTVTTSVSLNLQNVSTVFLSFVGDDQGFVDRVTDYVYSKGMNGNVTGNFLEYNIDPEAQTATFSIYLSTGGTVRGVFDKNGNTYSLSGL